MTMGVQVQCVLGRQCLVTTRALSAELPSAATLKHVGIAVELKRSSQLKTVQGLTSERGAEMMLKSVYAMMAGCFFTKPNDVNSPLDERTREKSRNVISVCICVTTRFLTV